MPIPINAVAFSQPLDPGDVLDFRVALSQGPQDADPPPILLLGESVAGMSLAVTSEAASLGLTIVDGAFQGSTYPSPSVVNNVLAFWLGVSATFAGSASFLGPGTELGIDVTIRTNNTPPRIKNRTIVVRVRQIAGTERS